MRKRHFATILLGLISCTNEPELIKSSPDNQVTEFTQSNKNTLLSGIWIVENLDIPDCKLCQENNIMLNKMWNRELKIKDTFQFTTDSMFYKSVDRKSFAEKFLFRDSILSLVGSDWGYMMDVRKHTPQTLTLAISQQYISEINSTEGPKHLIVTLVKNQ
jgi:hypothetical protein